jgi:hypothetical protein
MLASTGVEDAQHRLSYISGLLHAMKKHRDVARDVLARMAAVELEAQRHIGKLLLALPRQQGERTDLRPGTPVGDLPETYTAALESTGLSRGTARRYQHLAQVPESSFYGSLKMSQATGTIPTRIGVIRDGQRQRRGDSLVRRVTKEAVEMAWPDLGEARNLGFEALRREYGWVENDWLEYWLGTVVAEKLLEVAGLAGPFPWVGAPYGLASHLYAGDIDTEQAIRGVSEVARELGIREYDSFIISEQVKDIARMGVLSRGETPPDPHVEEPSTKDLSAEQQRRHDLNRRLNPVLGTLGQLDRFLLEPAEFAELLCQARPQKK